MSLQYQIPTGFVNGQFVSPVCVQSGWAMQVGDQTQAAILSDWNAAKRHFRAAHFFANAAFARTAVLSLHGKELAEAEKAVINTLRPLINQRDRAGAQPVHHVEDAQEAGWIGRWRAYREQRLG